MYLYFVPLSIAHQKLYLFIDNKLVANFSWGKPLRLELEFSLIKKQKLLINIKEGKIKNHYFEITPNRDQLFYLKKNFDIFGTRLAISEDKKFKTLIAWKT